MRISDWSSDVCSSDLLRAVSCERTSLWWPRRPLATLDRKLRQGRKAATVSIDAGAEVSRRGHRLSGPAADRRSALGRDRALPASPVAPKRSEEHTSELQSLMSISYAVFCYKKKKTNKQTK